MDFFDWAVVNITGSQVGALFAYMCILSILLIAGKFLRVKVKLFQRIFFPASVIAGFVGLLIFVIIWISGIDPTIYSSGNSLFSGW